MAEQRPSARKGADPLVVAFRMALAEAMETRRRRELEQAERRGRLRVVDGGKVAAA